MPSLYAKKKNVTKGDKVIEDNNDQTNGFADGFT
jgi:hypothetical protein